jgi:Flp pilus assembly protein TadG
MGVLRQRLAALRGDQRGSVVVEFVITLPLIFAMLVLIAEFGRAIWYHHVVTKGVRDATRYLSRAPVAAFEDYRERAEWLAMTGDPSSPASPAYAWWTDIATVTASGRITLAGTPEFRTPFEVVSVQAAVPVTFPMLVLIGQGPTLTIAAADQARYIGD